MHELKEIQDKNNKIICQLAGWVYDESNGVILFDTNDCNVQNSPPSWCFIKDFRLNLELLIKMLIFIEGLGYYTEISNVDQKMSLDNKNQQCRIWSADNKIDVIKSDKSKYGAIYNTIVSFATKYLKS